MKTSLALLSLILLLVLVPRRIQAQQYVEPTYNKCIRLVDGGFGTIAIQNTCRISISVQWVPFRSGSGGQLDISPGSSQGTGATAKEKAGQGGWDYYICPKNYVAVDAEDNYVSEPNTEFKCKKE